MFDSFLLQGISSHAQPGPGMQTFAGLNRYGSIAVAEMVTDPNQGVSCLSRAAVSVATLKSRRRPSNRLAP
jgi:hypothetical protein